MSFEQKQESQNRLRKWRRGLGGGRGSKLRVWKNHNGEWCVGNDCIKLEATAEGTHIKFNPDAKKCPPDMKKAAEAMLKTAEEGKSTAFRRLPEKW